jgi:hypothetical protein
MGTTLTYRHNVHNLEITETAFGKSEGYIPVIASAAKQSISQHAERWIASLRSQ